MTTDACRVFAERIQSAFGGPLRKLRKEFRVLCPVHESDGSTHRPSLAIWPRSIGGVAFTCMTGCPHSAVREQLVSRGITLPHTYNQEHEDDDSKGIQRAQRIVEGSSEVKRGDPVDLYLTRRGITYDDSEMQCFRIRPGKWERTFLFVQVVVDPISLDDDMWEAVGVQVTSLRETGEALNSHGSSRKLRSVMGRRRGCGVAIGKPHSCVIVGEGVESTWSAMRLLSHGFGIAALGAMGTLALPACVHDIVIAADNDRAGLLRARKLAMDWTLGGYRVRTVTWGDVGAGRDANDALLDRSLKMNKS